jgi:signal transduction histidine kinase
LLVAAAMVFARHAVAVGRALGSRIGHGLAAAECLLAIAIAARTTAILLGWTPADSIGSTWDLAAAITLAVLAALFGNLGYLGLVLGRSRAAERAASAVQWEERLRRDAAEDRTASLRDLLHQRDELAAERDQLLKLLAHEIRQPLHNASGALQAARAVLGEPGHDMLPRATERLQRAQGVLADVRSVLDNTLAAANLLGGEGIRHALTSSRVLAPLLLEELRGKDKGSGRFLDRYPKELRRALGWRWSLSGRLARRTWLGLHGAAADRRLGSLLSSLEEENASALSNLLFGYRFERYGVRAIPYLLGLR